MNETPKLAIVGAVDSQGLRALIEAALASPGLTVIVGGERRLITNEAVVNRVKEVAGARLPRAGLCPAWVWRLLLVALAATLFLRRRLQRQRARERVEEAVPQGPQEGLELLSAQPPEEGGESNALLTTTKVSGSS